MTARRVIAAVDLISYWSGKAGAWLIVALTFVVSIEVFKRYILNAPTAWIFDFNNMLYGSLFILCGAYPLALGGHGRLALAPGRRRGDRRHRDAARAQRVRRRGVAPAGDGRRPRHRRGRAPPQ